MAIKRTIKATVTDIEEVARQYYEAKSIVDEQTKICKQLAETLKEYAVHNPEKWEGNTFRFGDQVRIERRDTLKATYDAERLTDEWLKRWIDEGGCDYMDVKFDDKNINIDFTNDSPLAAIIDELGYEQHREETLVVYKQK